MTNHTHGTWRYEPSTKTIRSEPANYWLASMNSWEGAVDHEANALVMAAAPQLLAVLRSLLLQTLNGPVLERDSIISEARAIIAKAEGRS